MSARRFPRFALGVSVYALVTILWGYFLRISESGDGCGTDWPLCHGSVVPLEAPFPTWVEYVHRLSSGGVLLLVGALAVWAFRAFPPGHVLRRGAGFALLFTVTESLFGALLVVFGWVAGDISLARILIRPFHVTNTFLLMASLALTAWWGHRGADGVASRLRPTRDMALALLGVLALAWTGSWTGLASTAFPAASVREGLAQYLSPQHLLIYLRTVHPFVAVAVVAYLVRMALGLRSSHAHGPVRALATAVGLLAGAQLVFGPLTILLLQPAGLRLFHLLLADLLWIAVVLLAAERATAARRVERTRSDRAAPVSSP
jgi:heme A synthase